MAKKIAFLVGINSYSVSKHDLFGCVPDVENLKRILVEKFDFPESNIVTLIDRDATSVAIKDGLNALIQSIETGDVVVFQFSGHGTSKGFNVLGEEDGRNEALVPYDMSYSSLITDDELNEIILQTKSDGSPFVSEDGSVSFTAIYDCCHSGTMDREIYFDADGDLNTSYQSRCILEPEISRLQRRAIQVAQYNIFSACKDDETAADLFKVPDQDTPRGAFSYALHKLIEEDPQIAISDIETKAASIIESVNKNHKQTPQYYSAWGADAKIFQQPS